MRPPPNPPCGPSSPLLLPLAFLLLFPVANCFKAHEFKTCDQAHFCKRNRDRAQGSTSIALKSGGLSNGAYKGVLSDDSSGAQLYLQITAYEDSIVRVAVNEHPSKKRFEVPDVVEPSLAGRQSSLAPAKKVTPASPHPASAATAAGPDSGTTALRFGPNALVLHHAPFAMLVYRGDTLVASFNTKGLFAWEEVREKKEGDEEGLWEEEFHGHKDSKPRGPEAISLDVTFHHSKHAYGLAERATSMALKPTRGGGIQSEPYRLYNLDVFEYLHESPFGLYGSIPLLLAHSASAASSGVFWLNSAEMWVDLLQPEAPEGHSPPDEVVSHWIAESGIMDLFFFVGPTPKDVLAQYTTVTGTTAMPQLFAIAYHQCRWNYRDEADVDGVDAGFDAHDIPYDVLWLDIEHTDGKKYMTWDTALFPTPEAMQGRIAAKGRKMVTIVDPHMKRDDGYALHTEAQRLGYYVKDAAGADFDGWCWPGSSSYLDMLSPSIRAWWASKLSFSSYAGSTPILYIWNDMNEPSVFNGPEVTMHKDNIHDGGVEHRDVHNAYGYYYHMATAQGLLERSAGTDRPFVLSRAVYAGTQKVGPIWTGDNTADWHHLKVSLPMLLTLGLNGIAFSGADVGGFFGNPDAELMLRWYQLGVFYPFFRAHAHLDTKRREPWLFGEPYTSLIREAVRTRYALLPYYYTLFRHAHDCGTPIMRPFFMEFPDEEQYYAHEESFLIGPSLLVAPVLTQGAQSLTVHFPGTEPWYALKTGQTVAPGESAAAGEQLTRSVELSVGLETQPVFLRGGSIIPRKDRPRRASSRMERDPYTLVVALNASLEAEGELYVDDGHSYAFREGAFLRRHFSFSHGTLHSSNAAQDRDAGPAASGFSSPCLVERIILMGVPDSILHRLRPAHVSFPSSSTELQAEEEMGLAWLRPNYPPSVLIIRNPGVAIDKDWSVKAF